MHNRILAALAVSTALTTPALAAPKQSVAIYDSSTDEAVGRAPVKICKVGANQGVAFDVHLNIAGSSTDTAKTGLDFTPIEDLHLGFDASATLCQTVNLTLLDDKVPEATKYVTATITAGRNARLYDGKAKITITDSDPTTKACPDGSTVAWDAPCPPPPPPTPTPVPVARSISVGGDSISDPPYSYVKRWATANGLTIYDHADVGDGLTQLIAQRDQIIAEKPGVFLLMIGANDMFATAWGGTPEGYFGAIKAFVKPIRDAGIKVGVATNTPKNSVTFNTGRLKLRTLLLAAEGVDIDYAVDTGNPVTIMGANDSCVRYPALWDAPCVHPGQTGHALMTPPVEVKLNPVYGIVTTMPVPLPPAPVPAEEQTCPDGTIIPAAETCPVVVPPPTPPPPPPPPPAPPEITLDGQPYQPTLDHDVNADIKSGVAIPRDNGSDPVGAYRQICGPGQLLYDDPIVWPGQPGKSHLHDFSGNTKVSGNSTYETLRQSGGSGCNFTLTGFAAQRTPYWISAVLDEFGNVRRPNFNSVYYKQIPKGSLGCGPGDPKTGKVGICVGTPNGLKMVTGNLPDGAPPPANLRTDAGRQVYLYCSGTGAVGSHAKDLVELRAKSPICPTLNIVISFPGCWKGPPYLDSPDHTSHLAYQKVDVTTGRQYCQSTHPYLITAIRLDYQYSTGPNGPWGWRLASDPPGAPAFSTEHGDVWIAWDDDVLDEMESNCIDKHLDCNGGNLGSGRVLIGASEPTYIINGVPTRTFVNPNPVEPKPPMPMVMP